MCQSQQAASWLPRLVCAGQIESADGLVRLVDGGRNSSAGWGRVEVRRSANSSEWGTVCAAYGLATETAYVICKQLGLPYTGVEWWDGAGDATGTAPILLAGAGKKRMACICMRLGVPPPPSYLVRSLRSWRRLLLCWLRS